MRTDGENKDNIFGERLKILRSITMDMSQRDFAKLLGIPQPNLSAYESGRNKPTIDTVINISDKCNVSIDWLCGRDIKPRNIEVEAYSSVEKDAPENDSNDYVIKATIYLSFK